MLGRVASIFSFIGLANGAGWTYEKQNEWGGSCKGSKNSPIDIQTANAIKATTEDIVDAPEMINVINGITFNATMTNLTDTNKHAIKFTPSVEPSNGKVKCAQFHFHFDQSEHTVNGANYFAEVHMVCYKQEFATFGASIEANQSDSLAVFGFFIEKSDSADAEGDADIQTIIDLYQGGNKDFVQVKLPTANTDKYYRYDGGLTTPGCNEIVLWTVFADTVKISSKQADEINKFASQFRKNNRETLPLNGRNVYVYEPASDNNNMLYVLIGVVGIALLVGIFMFMRPCKKEEPNDDAEAQPMK